MPAGLALRVPLLAQQAKEARVTDRFPRYVVQDLGTLGGPYSFSYNLNDAGVVSGGSANATQNGDPSQAVVNAPQTAFLWDRGRLRNLGTLGGPDSVAAAASVSTGRRGLGNGKPQSPRRGCLRIWHQLAMPGGHLGIWAAQPAPASSRRQQFVRARYERSSAGGRLLGHRCLRSRLRRPCRVP